MALDPSGILPNRPLQARPPGLVWPHLVRLLPVLLVAVLLNVAVAWTVPGLVTDWLVRDAAVPIAGGRVAGETCRTPLMLDWCSATLVAPAGTGTVTRHVHNAYLVGFGPLRPRSRVVGDPRRPEWLTTDVALDNFWDRVSFALAGFLALVGTGGAMVWRAMPGLRARASWRRGTLAPVALTLVGVAPARDGMVWTVQAADGQAARWTVPKTARPFTLGAPDRVLGLQQAGTGAVMPLDAGLDWVALSADERRAALAAAAPAAAPVPDGAAGVVRPVRFQLGFADLDAMSQLWLSGLSRWQQTARRRWLGALSAAGAVLFAVADYRFVQDPMSSGVAGAVAAGCLVWALLPSTPRYVAKEARRAATRMVANEVWTLPGEARIGPEGITHENTLGRVTHPWRAVTRADRTAELMLFHANGGQLPIPARAFATVADADAFWDAAERWRQSPAPDLPEPAPAGPAPVSFALSAAELLAVAQWQVARAAPAPRRASDRLSAVVVGVLLIFGYPALLLTAPVPSGTTDWLWAMVGGLGGTVVLWHTLRPQRLAVASKAKRLARRWSHTKPDPLAPCTVEATADGVHHRTAVRASLIHWPRIAGVHRIDGFVILDTGTPPLAIPLRVFSHPGDGASFASMAEAERLEAVRTREDVAQVVSTPMASAARRTGG